MKFYEACIACTKPRAKGKGFCAKHAVEHEKSAWVKAWRKYMVEYAKTNGKAVFTPPRRRKNG